MSLFVRLCSVFFFVSVCYVLVLVFGSWVLFDVQLWDSFAGVAQSFVYYLPHACAVALLLCFAFFFGGSPADRANYKFAAPLSSGSWRAFLPVWAFVGVFVVVWGAFAVFGAADSLKSQRGLVKSSRVGSQVRVRELLAVSVKYLVYGHYERFLQMPSLYPREAMPFFPFLAKITARLQYTDARFRNDALLDIPDFHVALSLLRQEEYVKTRVFLERFEHPAAAYFREKLARIFLHEKSGNLWYLGVLLSWGEEAVASSVVGLEEYHEFLFRVHALFPHAVIVQKALTNRKFSEPLFLGEYSLQQLFVEALGKNLSFSDEAVLLGEKGMKSLQKCFFLVSQVAEFQGTLFLKDLLLVPEKSSLVYLVDYAKVLGDRVYLKSLRTVSRDGEENLSVYLGKTALKLSKTLSLYDVVPVNFLDGELSLVDLLLLPRKSVMFAMPVRVLLVRKLGYAVAGLGIVLLALGMGYFVASPEQGTVRLLSKFLLFVLSVGIVWFAFFCVHKLLLMFFSIVLL